MTRSYLKLVEKVLDCTSVQNRTGINAHTLFGHQMTFDLSGGIIPIITTKPMSFNTIAKELFWFMKGQTDQSILEKDKVLIWKGNSSREYLDSRGLYSYKENETLGPIYGFQWRHFGDTYVDCHTEYKGGVDQLMQVINMIKTDPTSRRIIMTSWNPLDLDKMVLPPCHMSIQFHVEGNTLSGLLFQRSADLMLGVPFNITSYALLIHIIAKICGLSAGRLIHTLGNVHIYDNHVDGAREQLKRTPKPFPTLEMNFDETLDPKDIIENLNINQFKLVNYVCDKRAIKFKMAV